MSPAVDPAYKTHEASAYLTARGVTASVSHLEKLRARGPDDARDKGPDFLRDIRGACWYPESALNRYIESKLALRQFRAPAPQPANFRKPVERARRKGARK